MEKGLLWIGRAAGTAGAFMTVVAFALRASGQYTVAGVQIGTLLLAGTAAMVMGCFFLLAVLTGDSKSGQ